MSCLQKEVGKMITIGVLALQGSVVEHINLLKKIDGVSILEVKTKKDLDVVDGIILPGGESTTIAKLLHDFKLFEPLKERIERGLPVWGTCAGMILLAKNIVGESPHLATMDIVVKRNAYGAQLDSFQNKVIIPEISIDPIELVFIRAPWIEKADRNVRILCIINSHIVAARQDNMLVTSFHPELTDDITVHEYFANIVKEFI